MQFNINFSLIVHIHEKSLNISDDKKEEFFMKIILILYVLCLLLDENCSI